MKTRIIWAGVAAACLPAGARSITDVSFTSVGGEITLTATFEPGAPGAAHALYVAYDTEDKGGSLSPTGPSSSAAATWRRTRRAPPSPSPRF